MEKVNSQISQHDFSDAMSSAELATSAREKGQQFDVTQSIIFHIPDQVPEGEDPQQLIARIKGFQHRIQSVLDRIEQTKANLMLLAYRSNKRKATLSTQESIDDAKLKAKQDEESKIAREHRAMLGRLNDRKSVILNMSGQLDTLMSLAMGKLS